MIKTYIVSYGFKAAAIALLLLLFWQKDLHLQLDLQAASTGLQSTAPIPPTLQSLITWDWLRPAPALPTATSGTPRATPTAFASSPATVPDNPANTYSNLHFPEEQNISHLQASPPTRTAKEKKQLAYVRRFAKVARAEMQRYGIPASIKLAQGLIESNAGESPLARRNHNHFGIKCFSKHCKKGHCTNFTDDSHKDFFRRYTSAWESYRAHSRFLEGKRYRHLRELGVDYRAWAHGLKKAGYATDQRYAQKLIRLIENLGLDQYDH